MDLARRSYSRIQHLQFVAYGRRLFVQSAIFCYDQHIRLRRTILTRHHDSDHRVIPVILNPRNLVVRVPCLSVRLSLSRAGERIAHIPALNRSVRLSQLPTEPVEVIRTYEPRRGFAYGTQLFI